MFFGAEGGNPPPEWSNICSPSGISTRNPGVLVTKTRPDLLPQALQTVQNFRSDASPAGRSPGPVENIPRPVDKAPEL